MLVLSRKSRQSVVVGGGVSGLPEVRFTIVEIRGNAVKIGVDAPVHVPVHRNEIAEKIASSERVR